MNITLVENELTKFLPIILVLVAVQLVLMVIALTVCIRAEKTNGPKWGWALIIMFVSLIGPVLFFIFGRRNEE